jgi:hypothetical protein
VSGTIQGKKALDDRISAILRTASSGTMVKQLGAAAVRESKLLVHRKTGNLGRSIHAIVVSDTRVDVVASAAYAAVVELGSGPYDIRPKPGRIGRNGRPAMLAWGGARRLTGSLRSGASPTTFARVVHREGNKPYPYLQPGTIAAVKNAGLSDEIILAWNNAA